VFAVKYTSKFVFLLHFTNFLAKTTHFLMGAVYDIIILAIGIYRQIKASVTFKINSIN